MRVGQRKTLPCVVSGKASHQVCLQAKYGCLVEQVAECEADIVCGIAVGLALGLDDGLSEGLAHGARDGLDVGDAEGRAVGLTTVNLEVASTSSW